MQVIKNNKIYSVTELKEKWVVKAEDDKLSVSYNVSKEICRTADEVREYILTSDNLF